MTEDNAVNQVLAVRLLEKRGYSVVAAENGRAAVEALEKEAFHLVLMDIQMPGMDGFEATAAIRKAEMITGKHTPIVAMTAHALKGDQDRCTAAGMDGYVSKPIRSMDLFAVMEHLLATKPAANSLVWCASDNRFSFSGKRYYGVVNIGLANSSGDAVSRCSAFQRIAAVIRVRPLG